jgi:hypothetical protein
MQAQSLSQAVMPPLPLEDKSSKDACQAATDVSVLPVMDKDLALHVQTVL